MALGEEQRRRWQELEIETDARETESREAGASGLQQVPPTYTHIHAYICVYVHTYVR